MAEGQGNISAHLVCEEIGKLARRVRSISIQDDHVYLGPSKVKGTFRFRTGEVSVAKRNVTIFDN